MVKIFITGATGYIGGDALDTIVQAHPEYEITALVRSSDKGAQVAQRYASVKLAYGGLDDGELLAKEASQADIVFHTADADHDSSVKALIKGLLQRTSSTPGFLIHLTGAGILMYFDLAAQTFGQPSTTIYDDLDNVSVVTSLPDQAPHRTVEKIVLTAGTTSFDKLKTAIVCPPCIYGPGRGPGNQRSIQLPELCRATLQAKIGLQVGAGDARWSTVHVHDLSNLFLLLVEEAAAGGATADWAGKPAVWGSEGYYFAEDGEARWGDVAAWVADEAHKQDWIPTNEVKSITKAEADKAGRAGGALWGANSRSKALRAREALKWKPEGSSFKDDVAPVLQLEARNLGLIKGHAEKVAGSA